MLVPISTYNSSDNFKNFRETFVEEVATNFELLDKKFSTYNVDDMLQKRIDQTNSCEYLFYQYEGDNVDFIVGLDTSKVTDISYMFYQCKNLTTVPAFDTSNVTSMANMFRNCKNIEEIHMINISTNLDISSCTKMTREALLEVLGNLKDLTGSTSKRLKLGSTLLAKLTDDDKTIATNKNRTVA